MISVGYGERLIFHYRQLTPFGTDSEINLALYRRAGVLWREDDPGGNPWRLSFMRMLDMANDSGLFHTFSQLEEEGWEQQGNRFARPKVVRVRRAPELPIARNESRYEASLTVVPRR